MKKTFTISRFDYGREAYTDEYVASVERDRDAAATALKEAIHCFMQGRGWAKYLDKWNLILSVTDKDGVPR